MTEPSSRLILFWRNNGWFGLIFIVLGMVLIARSVVGSTNLNRLQSTAVETEATVAALVYIPSKRSNSSAPSSPARWLVSVDFTVDGTDFRVQESTSSDFFEELSRGQTVPILYLPEDPNTFWVEPPSTKFSPFVEGRSWGFLAFAIGVLLAWDPWVVAGQELKGGPPSSP